ncbi:glycosyltransferase family 31 protein [Sporormia fimetaria CBS 119925]|uniref:N-acetylgalactosaminide beta-1,3-galactosyltransferase n=1 Tax=Sporormia fimetaria CBS 119925 TaxID=1340428 RepID=A0A6A6V2C3_9PLEO|nr:glycosyltransferase family 31 protein [Sporormia fimetaria CBS 119925]
MLRPLLLRLSRRPWRLIVVVAVFILLAISLSRTRSIHHGSTPSQFYKKVTKSFFPPLKEPPSHVDPDYCANFPFEQLDDVQVVLKTSSGGAEKDKTKAHLWTVTSCIKNVLIVSDSEDKIGDHHISDILSELPKSYADDTPELKAYVDHKKNSENGKKSPAWKIDRFKFLPMVDKAYAKNPKAKWYVFLEPDVYFFWDTLFRLLDQMDPEEPHYMGAQGPSLRSPDRSFAYPGAGFVLSQGLMKQLMPAKPDGGFEKLATRFEEKVKKDCCGDVVLAYAILNTTGARLEALEPTFSGENLKQIRVDRDRWCIPLLSLHRVGPEELEKLWKWERTRPYTTKPFTYSSLLAYTHSHLRQSDTRAWWDNLSEAPVPNDRPAHRNAGSCGSECANDPHCLQWSYSQTVCRHASYVKLGNEVNEMNGGQGEFTSGWDLRKLGEMGFKVGPEEDLADTCREATWLMPTVR